MNTSQTIGMLFAAGAVLLPSCETERINERPIGIYPTENVYPSGPNALGSQGNSLLSEVQGGNPLEYKGYEEKLSTSQTLKEQYWKRTEGTVRTAMEKTILMMEKYGFTVENLVAKVKSVL